MLINHNLSYHSEYGNTKEDKFKDWALSAFRDCGDKEKKNNKIEKEQKTQQRQQRKPREKNTSQEGRIKRVACCEWIKQDEG